MSQLVRARAEIAGYSERPTSMMGYGAESQRLARVYINVVRHATKPATRYRATVAERFEKLKRQWRSETMLSSSTTDLVLNANYQQIIALGDEVIPLLLREMETEPNHWGWALRAITGCDPVPNQDAGRLKRIAKAWVRWGRESGYDW